MTIEELRVLITAKTEGLQEGVSKATSRLNKFRKTSDDMSKSNSQNIEKMKAKYDSLLKKLDIVNAQAEVQQKKLNGLREKYGRMSGINAESPKAIRLQEQILSTESKLQRLIETSDKTVGIIHEMDNAMGGTSESTNKSTRNFDSLNDKLQQIKDKFKSTGDTAQRSTGRIAGFANMLNKSFVRILKRIFIFNLIYKMIRGLINYLNGALSTNKQFVNSLNTIKTNLKVAFQPIYEFILPAIQTLMRALATLTGYIASFTSALFGKTYAQSFKAAKGIETAKKEMKGYGGAAKKAGKEAKGALAGVDEINTLSMSKDSDDSGGGGGGHELEMPDLTQIDEGPITRLQKLLAELFQPFKDAWGNEGQNTINAAKRALNSMKELIESIGQSFREVWTNGSGQDILESLLRILQIILKAVDGIASAFKKAWENSGLGTSLIQSIADAIQNVLLLIESIGNSWLDVWNNGTGEKTISLILGILKEVFDLIGDIAESFRIAWENNETGTKIIQGIADTFNILLEIVKSVGESLNDVWGEVGQGIASTFIAILKSTVGILKSVAEGFKTVWDNGGKHLFESLIKLGAKIFEIAGYIYTEFVAPFVVWFIDLIAPAIGVVMDCIGYLVDAFIWLLDGFLILIKGIKEGKLGEFFVSLWGGIKKVTEDVWNGIATFFYNTWDKIKGLFSKNQEEIRKKDEETWNNIKKKTEEIWNNLKTFLIDKIWNPIKNTAKTIWDSIKANIINPIEQSWTKLKELWDNIKKYILDKWDEIKTGISSKSSALVEAIKSPFNTAKQFIDGTIRDAFNWGKNLIGNIVDGIKSMIGKVKDATNSVIGAISSKLQFNSPAKEGPGKYADRWMPNLMDMLADGIKDNVYKVSGAVDVTANALRGIEKTDPNENVLSSLSSMMGAINNQSGGDTTIIVKVGEDTITEKVVSNINRQSRINGKTIITV